MLVTNFGQNRLKFVGTVPENVKAAIIAPIIGLPFSKTKKTKP
jgi:hypothetical protein